MKRFWSIIIAVVMLFTVLALASCGEKKPDPTEATAAPTAEPTAAPTAEPTQEPTAAPTAEPTQEPTQEPTAEPTQEPTQEPTAEPTQEPTQEPTAEPTQEPTATTEDTTKETVASGTTIAMYTRFDFGTNSKAVQQGKANHDFLLEVMTYDDTQFVIEYLEDSWKIWSIADYDSTKTTQYAIKFDSIITYDYDFDDDGLFPGWGGWSGYPYSSSSVGTATGWKGRHQYMKVRLANNTTNNQIGIWWSASNSPGYFTTLRCANLYLQGTVGSNTTTASKKFIEKIYDICYTSSLSSNRIGFGSTIKDHNGNDVGMEEYTKSCTFEQFCKACTNSNINGSNNWSAAQARATGVQFFFLGTYDENTNCNSRTTIKAGTWVEVDYVVFGSSIDQLKGYKSLIEEKGQTDATPD